MERFSHVLRRVDRELEVREPERSRILLELAGDLEDLYREYRKSGYPDREARRRAETWLAPDPGSVARLQYLHTPTLGRLLSSLSEIVRSRVETGALVLLTLVSIAGGLGALWASPLAWPPGPAMAVILAIGGLGTAVAGRHALDVFLSPERGIQVPEWIPGLPTLSAAAALTGALGASIHLRAAFLTSSPEATLAGPAWEIIGTAAGTAALGIVVALGLALGWFWLVVRVRVVRSARADLREVGTFTRQKTQGG